MCKRPRGEQSDDDLGDEAEDGGTDSDREDDASVLAAAKALIEASAAVPAQQAEQQQAAPLPQTVLGVPIVNGAAASSRAMPTIVAALAAPAEAACGSDGGIGALLHAIRDEVERSTLSAHTKELLLLHLLHSWSVLRMLSDTSVVTQQRV